MSYVSLYGNHKPKPTADAQEIRGKQHTKMENYWFTQTEIVKETTEIQTDQKTANRRALPSPHITSNNAKRKWTEFTITRQSGQMCSTKTQLHAALHEAHQL